MKEIEHVSPISGLRSSMAKSETLGSRRNSNIVQTDKNVELDDYNPAEAPQQRDFQHGNRQKNLIRNQLMSRQIKSRNMNTRVKINNTMLDEKAILKD